MTTGSSAWVVRSLRDWALGVRQGMALVTYRSSAARGRVLHDLTLGFEADGWKAETLECGACTVEDFVARIAKSEANVLFVLDPDRLLFGENADRSPFWVNFHRETLAGHAGVQIWWMRPNAAIRFGQQLPDLSRFFLLREDLKDEEEVERRPSLELQIPTVEGGPGDPTKARDLLQRALRAAASPNADPARVWLELGIPAIDEFLRSGQVNEALDVLHQLTGPAGAPEEALNRASGAEALGSLGTAFLTLSRLYSETGRMDGALGAAENAVRIYREMEHTRGEAFRSELGAALRVLAVELNEAGRREDALARAKEATAIFRELAQQRPDEFLPDLALSLNYLAVMLGGLGRGEEALPRAEESVRIYRQLVQQHPDAFSPGLAGSLSTLALVLGSLGRGVEALAQAEEAVRVDRRLALQLPETFCADLARSLAVCGVVLLEASPAEAMEPLAEAIRVLTPFFPRLPKAHSPLMQTARSLYLRAAQSAGVAPDSALLDPVAAIFEKLDSPTDRES